MPFPKPYRFTTTIRVTSPGAGSMSGFGVMANPTTLDQLYGVANFSSPVPIVLSVQEEGVDYPFFTRWELGVEPPQAGWAALGRARFAAVLAATRDLGTPLAVLTAPPDDTPIVVGKMLFYPQGAYAARAAAAWRIAAATLEDSPGSWIESIPASEYTVPVCQLLSEIQEHLLEDVNGGIAWGSGLWTTAEVLVYLNHRISRFLVETGILQVRSTQTALAADDFYNLPTDLIDLRRVAWTEGATTNVLPRADSMQVDLWDSGWESVPGSPQVHMQVPEPSLQVRIAPKATNDGVLDWIYVKDFPAVVADCSILPVPDEWVWAIKYGVLSDMLAKEGEANDPQRAGYAEKRFGEGVSLARLYMGTLQ